ncbi:MAG: hypothetical protein ACXWJC_06205 [Croceibacterium sp.]
MLRQLLTVLAILTGLAAAAPAQAAPVNDVASVRLVAAAELTAKCTLPSSGPAYTPSPPLRDSVKAPCPRPRPPIVLPPVMLRVDRSLE